MAISWTGELCEQLSAVVEKRRFELLAKENVVGVGIGPKIKGGKKIGIPAVVVFVYKKTSRVKPKSLIPKTLDGWNTDVVRVGEFRALEDRTKRFRPAPGGVSISHKKVTAGTLGFWIKDLSDNCWYLISNNHVIANSNNAVKGDLIYQPGSYDSPISPLNKLAILDRFVPIQFSNGGGNGGCFISKGIAGFLNFILKTGARKTRFKLESQEVNLVDAGAARVIYSEDVNREILEIGIPRGYVDPVMEEVIRKSGRTTGVTTGVITYLSATVRVSYGGGKMAIFEDQIVSDVKSAGGDSGSAVLNSSNQIVGLLFAGGENTTIINKIGHVLEALNFSS